MSRYLTSAGNSFIAAVIRGRLSEAGIQSYFQGYIRGGNGPGDIYVEEPDLARAREAIRDAEDISEDELARLSEASVEPSVEPAAAAAMSTTDGEGKRGLFGRVIGRLTGRSQSLT